MLAVSRMGILGSPIVSLRDRKIRFNMLQLLFIICCFICSFSSSALSMVFEDRCQSVDQWTFIDYTGNLKVEVVDDFSCPVGYGLKVLQIDGDVAMGLASALPLREGTFVALYKENAPRVQDADGVIMVWAQYGQNTNAEHNAKIKRPHVWLEQDNDLGFQFRVIDPDGEEYPIEERAGVGLITDSWNQTNWIWQKVQIEGNRLRAKYWPAEREEPDEWAIETQYAVKGDRFGLRINSGSIRVAYFAADTKDISIQTPPVSLFSSLERITDPKKIPLILFTNLPKQSREKWELVLSYSGSEIFKKEILLDIPEGDSQLPILLAKEPGELQSDLSSGSTVVPLAKTLEAGLYQVSLSNSASVISTECFFEVSAQSKLVERFECVKVFLAKLEEALQSQSSTTERIKPLRVIADAAKAHLTHAMTLFESGKTNESEASFRFVIETLSELHGYKGRWLKELGLTLDIDFIPAGYKNREGIGAPKHGIVDFYSPDYQIFFHPVKTHARSMVMGRSYEIEIPWSMRGKAIDRDFDFSVRLVSPFGDRVVAQCNTSPEIPTHQWKPGETYIQRITLSVLAEDAVTRPNEPVILDEWHNLLVTVTDPKSGAHVFLGNTPGDQIDRVGSSFQAGRFYVSSAPLEIWDFEVGAVMTDGSRPVVSTLRNCGGDAISIDAVLTVTSESGCILYQKAQPVDLPAYGEKKVEYDWRGKTVGNLSVALRLMRRGIVMTEAARELTIDPPMGKSIEIVKQNHVEKSGERFLTPIIVAVSSCENPVTVRVYAKDRLVGETVSQAERIVVEVEPWFGYYDIRVDCDDFSCEKRVVATVVETDGKDLLVNGEPFIVKGVNVHGLDSRSPERTASMMRIMRELGFNTWRGDYPARWQMELAYELNSVYTVLAPFSCARTAEVFGQQVGPPLGTARELTRLFIDRYKDSAGVLLWNSCNEIVGENIDFLLSIYPVYQTWDPYQRPTHYANLYGQDLWQGQDVMGVNYYFGEGQTAVDRQKLIQRSVDLGYSHDMPVIFCEYNSYYGAIHSTGVEAMEGLFAWGVEQAGMAGGFLYMRPNSASHPGVMDSGYNTHKIFDEAIRKAFADAEIVLDSTSGGRCRIQLTNKRNCTLRQLRMQYSINDSECDPIVFDDLSPRGSVSCVLPACGDCVGPDWMIAGTLEFVTHFGFENRIPFQLIARIP